MDVMPLARTVVRIFTTKTDLSRPNKTVGEHLVKKNNMNRRDLYTVYRVMYFLQRNIKS